MLVWISFPKIVLMEIVPKSLLSINILLGRHLTDIEAVKTSLLCIQQRI